MIRIRSNSLKSSGSFLSQVVGSNISFFLFVLLAGVGLFYGWRYLDQHRQVMKEAKAKADAAAAARPVVVASTSAEPVSNSVPASHHVAVNSSAAETAPTQIAQAAESPQAPTTAAIASDLPQPIAQAIAESQTTVSAPTPETKTESRLALAIAPEKPAPVRLSDAIASVFMPSAKAMTIQPSVPPLPPQHRHATSTTSKSKMAAPTKPLTAEEQRLKVAQEGFIEVMGFAKNFRDTYGFRSSENLEAAKLGEPIPVSVLNQPSRASYQGQPVESLLKPAEEWFFPIVLHERVRYMVLVQRSGQEYVLGQGSRALAMAYEKIQARWPASEGYHPRLILLPNTPFYYFSIPELPFENITDTSRMLDSNPVISPAGIQLGSWR